MKSMLEIEQINVGIQDYNLIDRGTVVGRVMQSAATPTWEDSWAGIYLSWQGYTCRWFSTQQEAFAFVTQQHEGAEKWEK